MKLRCRIVGHDCHYRSGGQYLGRGGRWRERFYFECRRCGATGDAIGPGWLESAGSAWRGAVSGLRAWWRTDCKDCGRTVRRFVVCRAEKQMDALPNGAKPMTEYQAQARKIVDQVLREIAEQPDKLRQIITAALSAAQADGMRRAASIAMPMDWPVQSSPDHVRGLRGSDVAEAILAAVEAAPSVEAGER